ncbi:MAG TPA: MG2 domain-containing protein, partial [Fimbriimonas sp.]|nr:MG2 domain-containing protein [Fimbriimonas sp.]
MKIGTPTQPPPPEARTLLGKGRSFALAAGVLFCCMLMGYGVTQEVPIGEVSGKVVMAEDGKPLPEAFVSFTPIGQIDSDYIRPRYTETKADGTFSIRNLPADIYEMDISAAHHNLKTRYVFVEEGKATDLSLVKMQPTDPYLRLYASQRVFTPGEQPHIEMHGFVKDAEVRVQVFRLDLHAVAAQGGLQEALYPLGDKEKLEKHVATEVDNRVHAVSKRDVEGAFIEDVQVPKLGEGFYYVRVSAGKLRAATYLNVTTLAMVTKSAKQRSLAFVTNIRTGEPVAGAEVLTVENGKLAKAGVTGSDGTVTVDVPKQQHPVVLARRGSSFAMVGFYGGGDQGNKFRVYTYTERPVYRPGDEIQFKGIVRRLEGDNLALPGASTVNVELRNNDGDVVETKQVPLSGHGTYYGSFQTAAESEPGDWNIATKVFGEESTQYVPISAYRKPEYSITVEGAKPYYIVGQKAAVKVKAEYYFGGPVIGAKVKAYVYRSPVWSYDGEEDEDWGGSEFVGGEFSEEIEAVTDANGEALIEFQTRVEGDPELFPTDFKYSVMASVADEGDKSFSGEGSVPVVRGAFALNVASDSYVGAPNEPFFVSVGTETHEEKPLSRSVELTL